MMLGGPLDVSPRRGMTHSVWNNLREARQVPIFATVALGMAELACDAYGFLGTTAEDEADDYRHHAYRCAAPELQTIMPRKSRSKHLIPVFDPDFAQI